MIKPFKLRIPNKTINEIYSKVKKYPWSNIEDMNLLQIYKGQIVFFRLHVRYELALIITLS